MARRRSRKISVPMAEALSGGVQETAGSEPIISFGIAALPPFESSETYPAETSIPPMLLPSIHHEQSADLLEATSAAALGLPSGGAAEIVPTTSLEVAGNGSPISDGAVAEALWIETPATTSDINGFGQSAAEDANQPLPVVIQSARLCDHQHHTAEAAQHSAAIYTIWLRSLNFTRAVYQINATAWSYTCSEREAAFAHIQAISSARSPSQLFELYSREMTRTLAAAVQFGDALTAHRRAWDGVGRQRNPVA